MPLAARARSVGRLGRKLRVVLLNASPETDLQVEWTTVEAPASRTGSARRCVPSAASGRRSCCISTRCLDRHMDQFSLSFAKSLTGDVFVRSIAFTAGQRRVVPPRPDIRGRHGIPVVSIPGIAQEQVAEAYAC